MAKVIETDNFGHDYPNEVLVVSGMSTEAAIKIAEIINAERCGRNGPRFWKVEPESYVLNTDDPA